MCRSLRSLSSLALRAASRLRRLFLRSDSEVGRALRAGQCREPCRRPRAQVLCCMGCKLAHRMVTLPHAGRPAQRGLSGGLGRLCSDAQVGLGSARWSVQRAMPQTSDCMPQTSDCIPIASCPDQPLWCLAAAHEWSPARMVLHDPQVLQPTSNQHAAAAAAAAAAPLRCAAAPVEAASGEWDHARPRQRQPRMQAGPRGDTRAGPRAVRLLPLHAAGWPPQSRELAVQQPAQPEPGVQIQSFDLHPATPSSPSSPNYTVNLHSRGGGCV